jgi:hemoglobin/transferrin/lactoferrin receptor protein
MVTRNYTYDGKDYIIYKGDTNNVIATVNAGYANILGGDIRLTFDITDHLSFKTYLTYIKGKDDEDMPIRHAPPVFGSTHLMYTKRKLRLELFAAYNGQKKYEDLAFSERDKPYIYAKDANGNPYSPRWWTLNFRGAYQLTPNFQLNAGLENILNYRYRPYSSGIVSPGRNLYVTLRVKI